jgi:hypothetical protein
LGVAGIFAGGAPLADFLSQAAQLFTSECSQDAPTSKMQHLLTEACDVEAGKAFLIALPRNAETVALRAQMLSRSQKGTSSARLKMLLPDEAWEFYVRSVLHMPQCPGLGDLRCACGQAMASDPHHFLFCRHGLRRGLTHRHDQVKHLLAKECQEAGFYVEEEVRIVPAGTDLHDDFKVGGCGQHCGVHSNGNVCD